MRNIRSIKAIPVVVGSLGWRIKETEELHRRTGSCYKHNIIAGNSTARDSSYIKEGFRLWKRFVETGVGEGKKGGEVGGRRERVPKIEQVGKNVKI